MWSTLKPGIIATCLLLMACSDECIEQNAQTSFMYEVSAEMPCYEMSKATAQNVVRVNWSTGDKVYTVNLRTGEVLGYLEAQENGTIAKLSGTLTGTVTVGDNIGYVYSPSLSLTQGETIVSVDISMATQTASSPKFVIYCWDAYSDSVIEGKLLKFNFATAMYHVNLANMTPSTTIGTMRVNGCADFCRLNITNNSLSVAQLDADNYITISSIKTTNAEGELSFSFSAPRMKNANRTIEDVSMVGKFDTGTTNAGAFYNVTCSVWEKKLVSDSDPMDDER